MTTLSINSNGESAFVVQRGAENGLRILNLNIKTTKKKMKN